MTKPQSQVQIQEVIVTTHNPSDESTHIAPMGIHLVGEQFILAPFKPSKTLDNLLAQRSATINYTNDMRIFAGCLTGRRDWPLLPNHKIQGMRLAGALAHDELEVIEVEDDAVRPRCLTQVVHRQNHAPFQGMNRAQAAVLELAILVSRLNRLPQEKIKTDIEYLTIAIEKTAGERERIAWQWLMEKVQQFQEKTA